MVAWAQEPLEEVPEPERPVAGISAFERKQLYARLLWLEDYQLIRAAEAALQAPLLLQLTHAYTSVHTRRVESWLYRTCICVCICARNVTGMDWLPQHWGLCVAVRRPPCGAELVG